VRGHNRIQALAGIGFLGNNGKGTIHGKAAAAGLIFGTIRDKQ
jgi:hypothetical protein